MKPHEQQIVRVLADSVRVMTIAQIARTWWTDTRWGRSRATASLRSLASDGWLHMQRVLSRAINSPTAPLIDWIPGAGQPEFGDAARTLHQRAMTDAKPVVVVVASRRAVTFYGNGRAAAIKLTQMTHDLNVSEVYLHHRRRGLPARRWVSEDRLPSDWPIRERPDALLRDEQGSIVRAVEYGGDYPASRLAELHAGLASLGIGYELW